MRRQTTFALVVAYLVYSAPVHALQCVEIIPDEAFEAASRVVIVRLDSIDSVADSATGFELSFDVLAVLKGPSSEKIEFTLEETRWVRRSHFADGVRYLWFLNAKHTEIGICEKVLVLNGRAAKWYESWQAITQFIIVPSNDQKGVS